MKMVLAKCYDANCAREIVSKGFTQKNHYQTHLKEIHGMDRSQIDKMTQQLIDREPKEWCEICLKWVTRKDTKHAKTTRHKYLADAFNPSEDQRYELSDQLEQNPALANQTKGSALQYSYIETTNGESGVPTHQYEQIKHNDKIGWKKAWSTRKEKPYFYNKKLAQVSWMPPSKAMCGKRGQYELPLVDELTRSDVPCKRILTDNGDQSEHTSMRSSVTTTQEHDVSKHTYRKEQRATKLARPRMDKKNHSDSNLSANLFLPNQTLAGTYHTSDNYPVSLTGAVLNDHNYCASSTQDRVLQYSNNLQGHLFEVPDNQILTTELQEQVTCRHCKMIVSKSSYKKYHYDIQYPFGKCIQYLYPCLKNGKGCNKFINYIEWIKFHRDTECSGPVGKNN